MPVPPRVVAIIQARMGSTRLPGKVMLPLGGEPVLARTVRRTQRASRLNEVVVATTTARMDDVIAELCRDRHWSCERGSEDDLLDRYHSAAHAHRAEAVVRVTSDCPLIDPGVIDEVVEAFLRSPCDYASNTLDPRTFPRGLDVEVIAISALDSAWREDMNIAWREHVTPYIYRHPEKFRLRPVTHEPDLSFHRWTLDAREDYELLRCVYNEFGRDDFSWKDVLSSFEAHPEWLDINRHIRQRAVP